MRLDDMPESGNVEDRRGDGGGFGGGGGGLPIGTGGLGIGGMVVLGLISAGARHRSMDADPRRQCGDRRSGRVRADPACAAAGYRAPYRPPGGRHRKFVARVLGSTEAVWKDIFSKEGQTYRAPKLVMFSGQTRSACGAAQSAMGPFYCPNDREVYLDTSFFNDLERRFRGCTGKACQFAQAYVIAHEVGHHVQNLLGVLPKVQQAQRSSGDRAQSHRMQVMVELQADCFAGVWAKNAEAQYKFLDPGDIEAALQTASAIGDDTLQRKSQGTVIPDKLHP